MFPVLFSVGSVSVYTLGVLVGLGFFLFSFFGWRRIKDLGLAEEKVIDLLAAIAFWSFLFSRFGFILLNFQDFGFFPERWFSFGRYPGFSFWGMILGTAWATVRFCRKNNWNFWRVADEVVFSYLPFLILVQIGCFFDGCWLGTATSLPWGLFFPGDFIRRQPLSLFSAAAFFLGWVFLLRIERQWRTWSWYKSGAEGFISLVFAAYVFLTAFWLAFWEEGGLYYLWFKKGITLLGLFLILFVFYRRSGLKSGRKTKEKPKKIIKQ